MTADSIWRPLVVLGGEFRVMVEKIDRQMDTTRPKTGVVHNIFDLVDEHLALLVDGVNDFADEVREGLGQLTDEPDEYYQRVAYRMNAELEGIFHGYDELRSLNSNHEIYEGWSLLVEIYDETLLQIQNWLEDVVEYCEDPNAVLKRRGLPTDGTAEVDLRLEMQPPRQLKRLTRWQERRGRQLTLAQDAAWAREQRRSAHRTGLIAGSMIGWWLGKG